jgi:hypothetical protein
MEKSRGLSPSVGAPGADFLEGMVGNNNKRKEREITTE